MPLGQMCFLRKRREIRQSRSWQRDTIRSWPISSFPQAGSMTAIKYSSAVTCNLIAGLFSNHKAGDLCPGITRTTSVKFVVPKLFCAFPRNEPANPAEYLNERSEEHTSELQSLTNLVCR